MDTLDIIFIISSLIFLCGFVLLCGFKCVSKTFAADIE